MIKAVAPNLFLFINLKISKSLSCYDMLKENPKLLTYATFFFTINRLFHDMSNKNLSRIEKIFDSIILFLGFSIFHVPI